MTNAPVPVPRTFNVAEFETAAYLNSVRDALNFLLNVPICNATQSTTQTLSTGVWTALSLDSTVVDSYGGHSNTTNNSRYTAQVAGWHLVSGAACIASNATSWRGIRSEKNAATVTGAATEVAAASGSPTTIATPSSIIFLNVGDYVESYGLQNSGGNLSTNVNSDADCALTVVWLHS